MIKIFKTDLEWKKSLPEDSYEVTRKKKTEPAFSGKYYNQEGKGVYCCVCCGTKLFSSDDKFNSGSGWPSYTKPISSELISQKNDFSYNIFRVEISCYICDAHLGHVFHDGPQPTGLRYCVNSLSLIFETQLDAHEKNSF